MKVVIVAEDVYVAKKLVAQLNNRFKNKVSFCEVPLQGDLIGNIEEMNPEILLTVDFAGFDRVTLTDNVAYNLLDCKQLHVICSEDLQNEKFLKKALSIAMFFACSGKGQCETLIKRYPHIPWIACMDVWSWQEEIYSDENVAEIAGVLKTVMKECRLTCNT